MILYSDPCLNVSCPPIGQCYNNGTCSGGTCYVGTTKASGTSCNNGNLNTIDTCDGSGSCVSVLKTSTTTTTITSTTVNKCIGVTCPKLDMCHNNGTCIPATGLCSVGAQLPNGTTCTNPFTVNNTCQAGVCVGIGMKFGSSK